MNTLLGTYPFALPPLPYAYNALEPFIDEETMHYHHDKHYATYIKNLNAALEPYPALQRMTLEQLLRNRNNLPLEARTAIMNNAGGVYNHTLFFNGLAPASENNHAPEGELLCAVEGFYDSFDKFKESFSKSAADVFGSGWTILASDANCNLSVRNVANQDTLLGENLETVIILDVWEHAYYLKYKNERADYIKNFWNIVRIR